MITTKLGAAYAVFTALLAVFSSYLQAQQTYRVVGPDGKVTFTDQPPPVNPKTKVTKTAAGKTSNDSAASLANLPLGLRNAANRFPVTLYTGPNCLPCDNSRAMLIARGVPFTEKTATSNEDMEALKRASGGTSIPFATIGSQQLTGYQASDWGQYLDLAGYPSASVLPASYRRPPASPLVAAAPVAPPVAPAPAPAPAPRPEAPAPANPAGIRF